MDHPPLTYKLFIFTEQQLCQDLLSMAINNIIRTMVLLAVLLRHDTLR